MAQRRATAAGRKRDDRLVESHVDRIDDLVALAVLEHAVLMNAR